MNIFQDLLAFACILSSVLVITSANPVVAVIYLISVFINAAGYLLLLGIGFIGITYILLYVGAITILFLFVIMSINISIKDIVEAGKQYTKNIPLALTIGLLFTYEILNLIPQFALDQKQNLLSVLTHVLFTIKNLNNLLLSNISRETLYLKDLSSSDVIFSSVNLTSFDSMIKPILQIEALGLELYTRGATWLILCSFILLLALVCPSILTRSKNLEKGI